LGYDLWGDNIANEGATLIPFQLLYQLMEYIQSEICKGSSSVLSYSEESIRILSQVPLLDARGNEEPINYGSESDMGVRVKYKQLGALKSYNIRFSWKFVKELNLAASKCLQFINMDLKLDKDRADTSPSYSDSLGYNIKYYRSLVMGVIKLELCQKIMQKTSVGRENDEVPKVELERLKARELRTKEGLVTAKEKEDHLFTKAHSQFIKIPPAFLRPFKPKGADPYLSFTVNFKGENVMGEAGPYRQFFTDIARELAPTYNLGLFIPSPNNRHQSGEHKSRWVVNPRANSTYHFSLFEFVGVLMGCCFRTGGHLAIDLPTMFWKAITRE
jgi:other hect domain ubiquitin protein ligase E3